MRTLLFALTLIFASIGAAQPASAQLSRGKFGSSIPLTQCM
jgi:hypothetical protein